MKLAVVGTETATERPLRRDAAENRERLLEAAAQVFGERGLDAGVDEVARVAGVGMGTLYRRFASKQALIDALVGGMRLQLLDAARTAAEHTDGSGLEELLWRAGEQQAAQPGCLQRLWDRSEAELLALEEVRRLLRQLLESAQEHGQIRADATATDINLVFWSLRGVIETTLAAAPDAWRRMLELSIAGLRPVGSNRYEQPLSQRPVTPAELRAITGR